MTVQPTLQPTLQSTVQPDAPSTEVTDDRVAVGHLDTDTMIERAYARLRERSARSSLPPADALDALQACAEKLLTNVVTLCARYPNPVALADALWASAPGQHRRTERIQRCAGSRFVRDDTGRVVVGREVVALQPDLDPVADVSGWDVSAERVEDAMALAESLSSLPVRTRRLLWLVRVEGYTVTAAAALLGWSRAHASRVLAEAEMLVGDRLLTSDTLHGRRAS